MTRVQAVKGLWSDGPFEAAAVLQVTGWETIFQVSEAGASQRTLFLPDQVGLYWWIDCLQFPESGHPSGSRPHV